MEEVPEFAGGQYLGVKVRPDHSGHDQIRQYSLSRKGELRISVKAEQDGKVSSYLHACKVGDAVSLQAPTGVFTLADSKPKHIFIAGGVGVTPMMSMLQEAMSKGVAANDLLFIQCAKDQEHQIFRADIDTIAANGDFQFKRCFDQSDEGDHRGFLNQDVLARWTRELAFSPVDSQVYFCGPAPFMTALNEMFIGLGYGESDIHYEVFGPTTSL